MCTFFFERTAGSTVVYFNRDEQRDRPKSDLPKIHRQVGGRHLYAIDPEGGGTWLGVNASGTIVGLLNAYQPGEQARGEKSRGGLVVDLLNAENKDGIQRVFSGISPAEYGAFQLFVLSEEQDWFCEYDGSDVVICHDVPPFLTTSSYEPEAVLDWRKEQAEGLLLSEGGPLLPVEEIFRLVESGKPAFGICMDREDARTVSFNRIDVTKNWIRYRFAHREVGGYGFEMPVELLVERD